MRTAGWTNCFLGWNRCNRKLCKQHETNKTVQQKYKHKYLVLDLSSSSQSKDILIGRVFCIIISLLTNQFFISRVDSPTINVSGFPYFSLSLILTSFLLLFVSGCLCDGGVVVAIFPPGSILLDVCRSSCDVLLCRTSVRRRWTQTELVLRLFLGLVLHTKHGFIILR